MKHDITTLDDGGSRLELTAQWSEVCDDFNEIVSEYRAQKIAGFRPGKAPENVVMRMFKKQIEEEFISRCGERLARAALDELHITPYGPLTIVNWEIAQGEKFSFHAEFVPVPQFDLPDCTKIPLASDNDAAKRDEVSEWLLNQCPVQIQDAMILDELDFDESDDPKEKDGEAWNAAARRARLLLILDKIAETDGIAIDDREIDERIEKLAPSVGMQPNKLKQDFLQSGGMPRLRTMLLVEKILDYLIEINR